MALRSVSDAAGWVVSLAKGSKSRHSAAGSRKMDLNAGRSRSDHQVLDGVFEEDNDPQRVKIETPRWRSKDKATVTTTWGVSPQSTLVNFLRFYLMF